MHQGDQLTCHQTQKNTGHPRHSSHKYKLEHRNGGAARFKFRPNTHNLYSRPESDKERKNKIDKRHYGLDTAYAK